MILGVLTLVAIITFSPHALSQQNPAGEGQENGIPLGGNYGITALHSDQAMMGWAAGIAQLVSSPDLEFAEQCANTR